MCTGGDPKKEKTETEEEMLQRAITMSLEQEEAVALFVLSNLII